jgi:2-methylcitrate dehydratase PrpD
VSLAQELGAFVVGTPIDALPDVTLDLAAMLIASTVASAASGSGITSASIIRELAFDRGGRADASIWFAAGPRLPLADAAQANAVASDAAASDDTDLRNVLHAGTPSSASALAVAERDSLDGESVLAAIVLAYQLGGRLAAAITPGFRDRGFHACIGAIFCATAASGRLRGLSPQQMAHAIALSATSIGGLIAAADTSTSREYHAGLATQLGVTAVLAAERGYEGELGILEARRGFFEIFGGVDGATASATTLADLEHSWDISTDVAIKLAPGGHTFHAIAEAAALAAQAGGFSPDEVASIAISRPGVVALSGERHPHDLVSMAHSPAYFAAAGVVDRSFSWLHASPEKIADPAIHEMIEKVEVAPPPERDAAARFRMGATVTITALDNRIESATVYAPKGSATRGVEWDDIDSKYRALLPGVGVDDTQLEASLMLLHRFRELAKVRDFIDTLQSVVE